MIQDTIDKLKVMYLYGIAEALQEQLESVQYTALSFEERISFLVDREYLKRGNAQIQRALSEAKLKQRCSIEDVDFETKRGLQRAQVMELSGCTWVDSAQNLIVSGPTGVGKSFLACALGERACRLKYKTLYFRFPELVSELLLARSDASYPRLAAKLSKTKLLIIDEWLRDPLAPNQARALLDLLDDRYNKASTIFISQIPVSDWYSHIADPTIAEALLDRIVHNSHRIEMKGTSMRKRHAVDPHNDSTDRKGGPSLRSDQ